MFVGYKSYALHLPMMIGLARRCLILPESFAELIRLFDTRYRVKGQYFTLAVDNCKCTRLIYVDTEFLCEILNSVDSSEDCVGHFSISSSFCNVNDVALGNRVNDSIGSGIQLLSCSFLSALLCITT